jgi:hypothetical protein
VYLGEGRCIAQAIVPLVMLLRGRQQFTCRSTRGRGRAGSEELEPTIPGGAIRAGIVKVRGMVVEFARPSRQGVTLLGGLPAVPRIAGG